MTELQQEIIDAVSEKAVSHLLRVGLEFNDDNLCLLMGFYLGMLYAQAKKEQP